MADTKISGLPASTTPLAGTEVLPIVQSGTTKQVSIANVTAGRDISASTVQATTTVGVGGATPTTSGAGITFPATQSASSDVNTLDDYEEGTWTPTGNGISFAAGTTGKYTKIGNLVTLTFTVFFPTTANTSNAYINAMPFTSSVNSASPLGNYSSNINLTVNTGNTYMAFLNSTGTAYITNAGLSTQVIVGSISYQI